MTTFDAISLMIANKSAKPETLLKMIFDAYYTGHIDGHEYEFLYNKVSRK